MRKSTTQAEYQAQARRWIATTGRTDALRVAREEVQRAVNDVEYPFGRIGLYAAALELLEPAAS